MEAGRHRNGRPHGRPAAVDAQAPGRRPRGACSAQGVLRPAARLGSAHRGHARHRGVQGPLPYGSRPGARQGGQGALQAYHEPS
eukprot:7704749-Alexandrium_andersonii.AAC.1